MFSEYTDSWLSFGWLADIGPGKREVDGLEDVGVGDGIDVVTVVRSLAGGGLMVSSGWCLCN